MGNDVIVSIGSFVSKDIGDNLMVCGNPLRVICTYDEYIKKNY